MKRLVLIWAMALGLVACGGGGDGDDNAPPTTDAAIATVLITGGNNQTGTVGTTLSNPLKVQVLNAANQPISGQVMNFIVTSGGGQVFASAVTSDVNGFAHQVWTLGTIAGTQSVEVRGISPNGVAVLYGTFHATAVAGAPQMFLMFGDGQSAQQLATLARPIGVAVRDLYGNPVAGIVITFTAENGGSVSAALVTTNAIGRAETLWTLGASIGSQTLSASTPGWPTGTFSATATQAPPSAPAHISIVSGNSQTIPQYHSLMSHLPLEILVADQLGNGVPGVPVTFSALSSGSTFVNPATVSTDAAGKASWKWGFFYETGPNIVNVSAPGLSAVSFTINVLASTHAYDGIYACNMYGRYNDTFNLEIIDGKLPRKVPLAEEDYYSANSYNSFQGTLIASDGTIDFRWGVTAARIFSGALTVDSSNSAVGSGTWLTPLPASGTWDCSRF